MRSLKQNKTNWKEKEVDCIDPRRIVFDSLHVCTRTERRGAGKCMGGGGWRAKCKK